MPTAFTAIFSFIFGAVIGSFLNVVSLRLNSGVGVNGRSKCMSCGRTLSWRELIPVASFVAQRGRCRNCKSRISWQYPIVELLAGAVFALIFVDFPPTSPLAAVTTLIYLVTACLALVITAYDWKHKIIPDSFVYSFDAVALLSVFVGGSSWLHAPHWATLLAGPAVALPFALLWLASKGRWMGLGDGKLALGIGWLLGMNGGVNAVVLAFWSGAVLSLIWVFAAFGKLKPRLEVPFGPYLILGMYLVLLFGIRVIDLGMLQALF